MITRILYFVALLGALLGIVVLVMADVAPDKFQAASISFAVAYAVIPLCLAIAWDKIASSK